MSPSENPYQSVTSITPSTVGPRLSLTKALITIVCSAITFSLLGGGIGFLMGVIAPGFYRGVFAGDFDSEWVPTQVGLGLGITQGLAAGTVVGLILCIISAWAQTRYDTVVRQLETSRDRASSDRRKVLSDCQE